MPLSKSLNETEKIAQDWLSSLKPKPDEATVIGLSGHLGSGKTSFTQAVAKELGVKEFVTSPTFVLMKIYSIANQKNGFEKLIHIDAYRLERPEELEALNFDEIVSDTKNLVLIEWPENVKEGLPTSLQTIKFETISETEREIKF